MKDVIILGAGIAGLSAGFELSKSNIDFQILESSNKVGGSIETLNIDDFQIETEILMKASRKGFTILSVPIQTIYRDEKSKINPVKDTLRFICYFARELFHRE